MNATMYQGTKRSVDASGRIGAPESDVSFAPPEGLELEGDSGEALVKWKRSDNRITITSIDGISLGGDSGESDDEAIVESVEEMPA